MKKILKRLRRVFYFLINNFEEIKILLNEEGITNLRLYKTMEWRHEGVFYFLGNYEGKRVFIKYMDDYNIPQNEWNAYNQLKESKKFQEKYFIKYFCYKKLGDAGIVVSEYVKGKTLKEVNVITKKTKEYIIDELSRVIDILHDAKIIHRDINPSNIYFKNGDAKKVKIIDFAYSLSTERETKLKETIKDMGKLRGLDEDYIEKPFVWDDVFAMKKVIAEKFGISSKKIEGKQGKLVYKAKINRG